MFYSLSNFQIYNIVLLTIVTMLYVMYNYKFIPLTTFTHFSLTHTQPHPTPHPLPLVTPSLFSVPMSSGLFCFLFIYLKISLLRYS